ncbi:Serine/threonine-protein phosphatase 7 long form homolog, partial [Linum perenne]
YEGFLRECRLLPVVRLLGSTPCKELVTAFIERWRPETNTFHLIQGEATITLEDVEVLTSLPTDGVPVTVAVDRRSLMIVMLARLVTCLCRFSMNHFQLS